MKKLIALALVTGSILASSHASAQFLTSANNLYNTGYNGNTLEAPGTGVEDTHYTVEFLVNNQAFSGPTYTGPIYTGGGAPPNNAPSPTSTTASEVTPSPTQTNYAGGLYVYQLALTGLVQGTSYTITGDVAGDDQVISIGANGSLDNIPTTTNYTQLEPFSLTFTAGAPGANNVDFTVNNVTGYTGLLVDNLSGVAAPEPSSWALLLGGFGTLGFFLRRRMQSSL